MLNYQRVRVISIGSSQGGGTVPGGQRLWQGDGDLRDLSLRPRQGEPGQEGRRTTDPILKNLGVSENSVPLNPTVNDHYPY
jgi:hypothetical protein